MIALGYTPWRVASEVLGKQYCLFFLRSGCALGMVLRVSLLSFITVGTSRYRIVCFIVSLAMH